MASTSFTWVPSYGAQQTTKPAVRTVRFGDGYEQRLRYGLRTIFETWNLTFENINNTERGQIIAFLTARAGVEQFNWTTPEGSTKVFVCEDYGSTAVAPGRFTVNATFREVVDL